MMLTNHGPRPRFLRPLGITLAAASLAWLLGTGMAPDDRRLNSGGTVAPTGGMPTETIEYRAGDKTVRVLDTAQPGRGGEVVGGREVEISRNGRVLRRVEAREQLHLRYATFDPMDGEPPIPEGWHAPFEAMGPEGVYIVQFHSQPLSAYREVIEASGGVIHTFLPFQSYLVRLPHEAVAGLRGEPFVRWIGAYHPAYRIESEVFEIIAENPVALAPTRFNIMVFERGPAQKQAIAEVVAAVGGRVEAMIPDGFIIEATLDGMQLASVLQRPEVHYVDRWGAPEDDLDIARAIGGANFIENTFGFTGQGVRAEVMDGNLLTSHQDFQINSPIIHGNTSGSMSHGTNVYGIVFGSGAGSSTARGFMPNAQGIFASYGQLGNRYQHTNRLVNPPYNAVLQTNSWGGTLTMQYTTVSAEMDDILLNNNITILNSQSNTGNRNSRPQAWAKNIVSVGGVKHQNTLTKNDDNWTGGGSIGPAADGRIKPDLTHFYDNIRTTASNGGYTNTFGGTSGATPITAGHFGLMFQMWHAGVFGNPTDPQGTVFSNRPWASTAKALMINSAVPYPFTGLNGDLRRVHQGWGMADLQSLHSRAGNMMVVDSSVPLRNLESVSYQVIVEPSTPTLRVTLVYTDPAGTPSSGIHRINDLSVRVTSPTGTVYWGNNGLYEGVLSVPNGSEDTINTVENVFIANPTAGTWTVEVRASEVNQDAWLATQGVVDAAFGLVVSGIRPPASVAAIDSIGVISGTHLSGTKDDLTQTDGNVVVIRSQFGFSALEPNITELRVDASSSGSPTSSSLTARLRARLTNPGGQGTLRLRNWTNGLYPVIATFPVGTSAATVEIEGINPALHVNQNGQIEARIRHVVIATFTALGFNSEHDLVELEVH